MRTVLSIAVLGALAFAPASARAQDQLPTCPADREAVETFPPDYVREGGALAFSVGKQTGFNVVGVTTSYTVAANGARRTEAFTFPDEKSTLDVIRALPAGLKRIYMRFEWDQGVGGEAACHGTDEYPSIPVVPANAKVGRPGAPRLSGRWRVAYDGGRTADDRAEWRLTPRCDVFGCSTTLRSNGGLRGTLQVLGDGTYRLQRRSSVGFCVVTYASGRTVKWRTYAYQRTTLRARRVSNGSARLLTGRRTIEYDTPSDELDICDDRPTERQRLRAVKRQ